MTRAPISRPSIGPGSDSPLEMWKAPATLSTAPTNHEAAPARSTEQGMTRALRLGVLVGIPAVFDVTGAMGLIAGAGVLASLAIAGWTSFFGGGVYLGGMFFLPRKEEVFERPAEWPTAATAITSPAAPPDELKAA